MVRVDVEREKKIELQYLPKKEFSSLQPNTANSILRILFKIEIFQNLL